MGFVLTQYYSMGLLNLVIVMACAALVEATTPAAGSTKYHFLQETNIGKTVNFGASIGVNFGPVNIGVDGGEGYTEVSPIQWFFPGQTPLPQGTVAGTCWPADPVFA
jgi:hypothetical protein